ncbi:MAG: aldo/keto reductase [Flavobacteriaceae bacterium]|nr:aldo/keto reductase [Bacteroidia bacterium]NNF74099.1 aldo/keto reductase [Flavobacteriaceae bacterium]NNK71808.1 aldo/keto reductase [Flavobacteriaceae bacterium]
MSQLKFSKIISGAMTWGRWGKSLDSDGMIALMNKCLEIGIDSFDHADIYGGYTTEADFGNAFSKSRIDRENIKLISKCGIQYVCEQRPVKVKHYNYNKDYIIKSVETSLKNLNTDYLDLFLLHRPSPLMHPQEVMEAVAKLGQEGKIIDFGVSNFTTSQVELIASEVPVLVNQVEFSLSQFNAMHDGTLDQMIRLDMIPMAWSPLGNLFREENEQVIRIHQAMEEIMEKYDATADQLALAWIMKHPAGIHPVVGTTNMERLTRAQQAISIDMELEDWFTLLVASQGHKVP